MAANSNSYVNMVDGDDGGYLLTSATAPPTQTGRSTGAYDVDFDDAEPGNKKVQCDLVPIHAGCSGFLRVFRRGRQALLADKCCGVGCRRVG